jgi:hypothetical protein
VEVGDELCVAGQSRLIVSQEMLDIYRRRGLHVPYPVVDAERKIMMFFSAKAGSKRAVATFFAHLGILDDVYEFTGRRDCTKVHKYRIHRFERRAMTVNADPEACYAFKVVRNPWQRAVSSFIQICRYPRLPFPCDRRQEMSFVDFLNVLKQIDLDRCDIHVRRQWSNERVERSLNRIVRIENWDEDMEQVSRETPLRIDPAIAQQEFRHHVAKTGTCAGDAASLPFREIGDAVPPYAFFFNQHTTQLIRELYALDVQNYGYDGP